MKVIAVIPARGGSKGIPGKNLADFCGKPLLYWTIAAARNAEGVDGVWVSTDSPDIATAATSFGASVIARPPEISGDTATSESALIHACTEIQRAGGSLPEHVLFLQATSPLRESAELTEALAHYEQQQLDSLFCATEGADHLWWLEEEGVLRSLNYDYKSRVRRQCHEKGTRLLLETGSFYITRTRLLLESGNRLGGNIGYFQVPFWKSFEIDEPEDLALCASLMRQYGLDEKLG